MATTVPQATARRENTFDVAIVGAGIIGCALASALGNQGRNVLLVERDLSEPDRIVGELLQPGGVAALETLGLRDCLEGIDAISTFGYEVIYHGSSVNIPYPIQVDGTRPEGKSFHHGKFIMKLREAAAKAPNVTIVEGTAKDLIKDLATDQILGLVVKNKTSAETDYYFASLTVSADGYASNFRKRAMTTKPQVRSTFVGLELIDCVLPNPNHGHVFVGNNPPVLLYQIGTHETRMLVDMPRIPTAAEGGLKKYLREKVMPDLPQCVQEPFAKAIEAERLPSMPNSFLPATTATKHGMILLGDALNMRHPLTGGGMTVALNDVVLISELLSPQAVPDLQDTDLVLGQMSKFHWRRKHLTSIINILAQALYALFAADDDYLRVLQNGCFSYFKRGGECISGPAGLLAGIIKRPMVLFYHFFAVALWSIFVMFKGLELWQYPAGAITSCAVFFKACAVIFPYIFSEMRS